MTPLDNSELVILLAATARGDRAAFAQLYRRSAPKLFAILLRILPGRSVAEDALQDVFLKIWQNAGSFAPGAGTAMGWLVSITRNRAIDIVRTKNPAAPAERENADYLANIADLSGGEGHLMDLAALRRCLATLE